MRQAKKIWEYGWDWLLEDTSGFSHQKKRSVNTETMINRTRDAGLVLTAVVLGASTSVVTGVLDPPVMLTLIVGIAVAYFLVKYPEVALALFVFSGSFKGDQRLRSILPDYFDLTVFFGVLIVVSILLRALKPGFRETIVRKSFILPYLGFVCVMLVSFTYTDAPVYGADKLVRFAVINSLAVFGPLFLLKKKTNFKRFFSVIIVLSTLMTIESLRVSRDAFSVAHGAFASSYLALGRMGGISSLLIIYYFLIRGGGLNKKIFWFALILVNVFGLFFSSAKAAIAGFFLMVVFGGLLPIKPRIDAIGLKQAGIGSAATVFILIVFLLSPLVFPGLTYRINSLFEQNFIGRSVNSRLGFVEPSVDAFIKNPVGGLGVGGYSVYYSGFDYRLYPHNIFLEVGSELGIFGLFFLIALIWGSARHLLQVMSKREDDEARVLASTVMLVFGYMFINTLVSSDLIGNRLFFVWIGVSYALDNITKKISAA